MVVDNTEIFFRVCRKTTIDKEQDIAGIYFGKKYKDTLNPVFFDIFKSNRELNYVYSIITILRYYKCFNLRFLYRIRVLNVLVII